MGQACPLEPGPEPKAALGPALGLVLAWSQTRAGSPGLGHWGSGPAHESAVLAICIILVCICDAILQ